jgi:predicted nucleic acid-binding protein
MADVVIDTDVASVLQKGRDPAWVTSGVVGQRVWLTLVTEGELWKWAEVRSWGSGSRDRLATWIARGPVLPYDDEIARTWGRLAAGAKRRGRPRPQTTPGSLRAASDTAFR